MKTLKLSYYCPQSKLNFREVFFFFFLICISSVYHSIFAKIEKNYIYYQLNINLKNNFKFKYNIHNFEVFKSKINFRTIFS